MITFFQAIIVAIVQGVTELFPISSLGHSVLIADLFGWTNVLGEESVKHSYYLTFLVALHVATAAALIIFYRRTWYKLILALINSIRYRRMREPYEKLIWLLIVATIPAGIIGLVLENKLRILFSLPLVAAIFLILNGFILLLGDWAERRSRRLREESEKDSSRIAAHKLTFSRAIIIGIAQSLALIAGISRSGVTMTSGLLSGLSTEAAARFSFLLATPIILAAGIYKVPSLFSHDALPMLPQTLVGAVVAGVAAYFSVRFLDKYFQNKKLWPFAIYCFAFGTFMVIWHFLA